MATSFQPEPEPPDRNATGKSTGLWTALIVAVAVFMLLALGLPQLASEGETQWLIAGGGAVLAFLIAFGIARFSNRPSAQSTK